MKLSQFVGAGVLGESAVLEDAAQGCGLVADDGWPAVRRTIASGLAKGIAEPRDLSKVNTRTRKPRTASSAARVPGSEGEGGAAGTGAGEERSGEDGTEEEAGGPPREPDANGFTVARMNREFGLLPVGPYEQARSGLWTLT